MTDWIEKYTKWSMQRSPLSPKHFHQNVALTLAAGAIAGRVYLQLPHEMIYPNLYTLIISKTTVFGKTTTFNRAREIIKLTMHDKVIREIATPESLIEMLSGKEPKDYDELDADEQAFWDNAAKWQGRRLFMLDEAGRLFNVMKRDYNSDLADIIMALYDPSGDPVSRRTRKRGSESIKTYALSCLFATTPAGIRSALNTSDSWISGFWVRWNFVAEQHMTPWNESVYSDPPKEIIEPLKRLSNATLDKYNDTPYSMKFEGKLLKAFNETTRAIREQIDQMDDEQLHGMLGRLPIAHLKASMIYALLEADGQIPTVQLKHWEMSKHFAEGWRRDAEVVRELASKSEQMRKEERVLNYIAGSPLGVSARDLARNLNLSGNDVQAIIDLFAKSKTIMPIVASARLTLWKMNLQSKEEKFKTK